ncbi:hypothetical protein H4W19_07505 [Pseudoxanthomonas mexicana]|uniref:Uncharacterized protein n=1 Tax=Pseudoxanthomonas mexicana TaxID=128785 RepID=A0ABX6RE90_PSEMX|nr:hypothetical protein [Pseudoxanthomonas mexicana]QLQ28675.1 MAG: hypothetical protein HZT39_10735 [Pseudoxanthomonas sp.]QND81577.1 hypothetical protein H4W19_07505 [Pseudoxanthomonas mexicana]
MTRTHWMAFRLYRPALACLLLAFVSTWGHAAHSDPWSDVLRWMPYALSAVAMLLAAVASLRLMRWETRGALICNCGGLLGAERKGPLGRYRKCVACGRNHALRE